MSKRTHLQDRKDDEYKTGNYCQSVSYYIN